MPDSYREPTDEPAVSPPKIEKPTPFEAKETLDKIKETPTVAPLEEQPKPPAPQAPSPSTLQPTAAAPKKEDSKDLDKDRQLKILVDLAFAQGIDKAVAAAKATGDAYLIDEFHDTLIDELHQQLIDKGKLKET